MTRPPHETRIFVALGSNLGDRLSLLEGAVTALHAPPAVQVIRGSGLYDTLPVGGQAKGRFLNAAVELATSLTPLDLLAILQSVESRLGRIRRVRWGDRVIDLDLVLWGDRVIEEPTLVVPHPELHRRRFVLAPLFDLAPEARHPVLGKTVAELLAALPDEPPEDCTRIWAAGAGARWPGWR